MKPISKTAFYCCGVRMRDAENNDSICRDIYAKSFMNEEGLRIFESFKDEFGPNAATIVRHRIIDDFLRRQLSAAPDLCVILIGAGFDSRAFCLDGGTWLELDEPPVIEYKNKILPAADCKNELHRIEINFSTDSLAEKLFDYSNRRPTIAVIEGVFMYLEENSIRKTLQILRRLFPQHKLIGDLMNRDFFEEHGRTLHEKLTEIEASFKFTVDYPEKIFVENGYHCTQKISIIETAVDLGLLKIPKVALETTLSNLKDGNAVYVFETC